MTLLKGRSLVFLATGLSVAILFLFQSQLAYAAQVPPVKKSIPLGIQSDTHTSYPGIYWLRLNYPTCGNSNLTGQVLKDTISNYHRQGIRVLLDVCQPPLSTILNPAYLNDAAQGMPDAVQGGNEEMKYDPPYTRYVPPDLYAQFFDLCKSTMQSVRPNMPVLMGSLDPRVVGPDNSFLAKQVSYLDAVQTAMNTIVYPGGNWSWRAERIGLIDSWHNGFPSSSENNLYQLFAFWAQQFQVDLNTQIAQHLWVVEGTGCFIFCGLSGTYQIAVSHIITLITDVLTTVKYNVAFFFFTGKDFVLNGTYFPVGVLDLNGNPKPLRQDLPMGARTLKMKCGRNEITVEQQEQLLALMYAGCQLPSNYASILES